jgi:hypothetical protein
LRNLQATSAGDGPCNIAIAPSACKVAEPNGCPICTDVHRREGL